MAGAIALLLATEAYGQTFECGRPSGWGATTGEECFAGRCWQIARDGTQWRPNELLRPAYILKIDSTALTIVGRGAPDVADRYIATFPMIRRNEASAAGIIVKENGATLLQFFFGSSSLHWVDSYFPLLQDQPPARLDAFVATCRRLAS